jgi:hypothetical protein
VLSKVADEEGLEVTDADVDAEVALGRERYAGDERLTEYFASERGRSFIRSTLRRSRVIERIVDAWLADHPEHPPMPHLEDRVGGASGTDGEGGHDHGAHDHDHVAHDHDHAAHDHGHDTASTEAEPAAAAPPTDVPARAG